MKRGLISWDREQIPPQVFEQRLGRLRARLLELQLPAAVIYTDVWRSNQSRFFTNFMMYWNRSLLLVPADSEPVLICGLSPRVYPWIRSVTILEEIRPGKDLAQKLLELIGERGWNRLGVLDLPKLPFDLYQPLGSKDLALFDIDSAGVFEPAADQTERAMRSKVVRMGRQILEESLSAGAGVLDYELVGELERRFRRAGAEDLLLLVSHPKAGLAPPSGDRLGEMFSVAASLEYAGHWVQVTRPWAPEEISEGLRSRFREILLTDPENWSDRHVYLHNLSGLYPFESCGFGALEPEQIFGLNLESQDEAHRLFFGDTCHLKKNRLELL